MTLTGDVADVPSALQINDVGYIDIDGYTTTTTTTNDADAVFLNTD